jgi:tripartite-type tricarboxylate transporter receptor subunit TctC
MWSYGGRVLLGSLLVLGADLVNSQNYPVKPVRIVTAAAGGGVDFAARLIAQGISAPLGQPVVVENRGGSGNIAAELVAKAPPDGYTVILYGSGFWLTPLMLDNAPYDVVRDFLPIVLTNRAPNILVVNPSLPVKSAKDLIALAKARPGELNYFTSGAGSSTHLAAELFKAMAGVNIMRINYKASAQGLTDLISGQVQVGFANAASATPHVKANRLRALAVGSVEPSALAPGLPTLAASGVPGYESASINALFAPAKTPAAIINRLNQEIVRVLNQPDTKERFFNTGAEAVGGSPEELGAKIKSEIGRMGKVIKDAGIRAE